MDVCRFAWMCMLWCHVNLCLFLSGCSPPHAYKLPLILQIGLRYRETPIGIMQNTSFGWIFFCSDLFESCQMKGLNGQLCFPSITIEKCWFVLERQPLGDRLFPITHQCSSVMEIAGWHVITTGCKIPPGFSIDLSSQIWTWRFKFLRYILWRMQI